MKMKTLIVSSASCVSLLAGCAQQTAHNDTWLIKPTVVAEPRRENPQAWYDLGRYYQGQARHALAVPALENAVAADGTFVEARNRLGVSYALLGRHADAIRQLEAAAQAAPEAAHIYSNLGYAHYLKGDYSEAAAALQRAVALDPANRRAQHNLGMVYAQLGEPTKARHAYAKAAAPQPETATMPATAMPAAAPEASHSRIVQVAPNIYELRPRPASTAAVMPSDRPSAPARVEVSNGNGITGMARRVGTYLKDGGFAAARLTNQQGFDVAATRVEYRNGYEAEAREVAAAMPRSVEVRLSTSLRRDIGVRLVLGRDMAGSLGYFEQKSGAARIAQNKLRLY
jgi:tetratricopeptide (TPR) repeat protein